MPLRLTIQRWLAVALLTQAVAAWAGEAPRSTRDCAAALAAFELQDRSVYLYKTRITGPEEYPLAMVLHNLGLEAGDALRYKGKNVLSVAEGLGDLADYFHKNGAQTQAVDLWYGRTDLPPGSTGDKMRAYQRERAGRLKQGDATSLPYPNKSQDLVLIHALVNNLPHAERSQSAAEAVRVLRPGGQARIYGFRLESAQDIEQRLKAEYGSEISVELRPLRYNNPPPGVQNFAQTGYLMLIERYSPRNESPWQGDD